MSNQGTSIRHAININPALPELVEEASRLGGGFVGFYWDEASESWDYWTSETADASATNCYYTPEECRALLSRQSRLDYLGDI
jgi:hypothetical protein